MSSRSPSMTGKVLAIIILLIANSGIQARHSGHRRLIIHVPVKMKTHHHTHTIYKVVHGSHGGGGGGVKHQTVYKVLGFSTHGGGMSKGGGGGGGHGGGGSHVSYDLGGMGHGEITYEDMHGCESGKVAPAARDMIFNHYSRHGGGTHEDYAEELDDFVDLRDDWL
ncbi:cold and drought-regulated protein CORA [Drosophila ficusphila]|uniref:cold and drought-regulated protein CORA n=1 Tax=Drosophila ficusphila TaxID=30025 RepID=UPI0007E76F59|nr:cold and drought-regulated protein CORA [Drosophila ficusphila]